MSDITDPIKQAIVIVARIIMAILALVATIGAVLNIFYGVQIVTSCIWMATVILHTILIIMVLRRKKRR